MKNVGFLAFVAIALSFSSPAIAVPPPPPSPGTLTAAQSVIASLTKKDFDGYSRVLTDDFVARKSSDSEPIDRATWLREMKVAFDNPAFVVTITHVFQGATTVDG
ncbi:hypothetical protein [Novosphingobium sp. PhB55]|uniref:hypothetical protein n=1 Tax=Novosphingobium sp. PhB55 TaxID=2485106 RepID=UPI0010650CC1|nr:hypothetical protein [Novosphingobium sp. PhB55]